MVTLNDIKVLVMEPPNRHLARDMARPNGSLGPAYLIGSLRRAGIEADYLDGTVGPEGQDLNETFYNRTEEEDGTIRYGMNPPELAEILARYDVVATSSIFTFQTRMHFEVAAMAKKVAEERGRPILTLSGGVNARALKEHFLANGFDIVALGEGETTILEIVQQFCEDKPDYSKINGIAFRDDGNVIVRPVMELGGRRNMDDLPFPALEALPLNTYQNLGVVHAGVALPGVKFAPMQTSRGCQDKCTFCHISKEKLSTDLLGQIGSLRGFSKERVEEDVTRASNLGVNCLYFEDDNLFYNKKHLANLAPILTRPGMEYRDLNGANLRFLLKREGNSTVVDTEFIELLAGFGFKELTFPVESRNVDIMQKYASGKYDPDNMDTVAILKALKKVGIRVQGGFMIGFRDESWESILRTKEFARELLAEGMDRVGFMIPVPFPGTVDFDDVIGNTSFKEDFDKNLLSYTDRMHPRGRPLFKTEVPADRLFEAVYEFWLELNNHEYTSSKLVDNVAPSTV